MKKIYILQMHTRTIPARVIRLFTGYKYSHIGLSLTKDCKTIISFGRTKYNSILNAGFVELENTDKFYKKFNKTECRIYELEVSNIKFIRLKMLLNNIKMHKDEYKYDYLGICLRYFRIPVAFDKKYVCSYFIAQLLEEAGICEFDKNICFVEPKDFEKIKDIKMIYQGNYLSYK